MATIAENLQTIIDIKDNIKTAIENKGVDMSNTPFSEYSTKIDKITTGGGTGSGLDFSLIGYDDKLSKETNDKLNESLTYSKQLYDEWDSSRNSTSSLYSNDKQLIYAPNIDTSNVTDMTSMFKGCSSLTTIPLLDTSNVTDMREMFNGCKSLTTIPLLDTSDVTNMYYMFNSCSSLQSIPKLNTSNVTTMENMFRDCSLLQSIPLLDCGNVNRMYAMFYQCKSLTTIPQLDTSNVISMESMFYNCPKLQSIPTLNTTNVTNMYYMFNGCSSLQSIPLLDCGKITNMGTIFGWNNITTLTDLGGFKDLKISITSNFLDKAPNLTTDSLMNVINNVYDLTANGLSGQSLKFGSTNLNKLTEEQIAVATAKGWTLTA